MANNFENGIESIETITDGIEDIAFDEIWTGDVCTAQTTLLKQIVSETRELESQISTFKSKVGELEEYKELLETIERNEEELATMDEYNTFTDSSGKTTYQPNPQYSILKSQIEIQKNRAQSIRVELMAYFNTSVEVEEPGNNIVEMEDILPDNLEYKDVDKIINMFFANESSLRIIAGTEHITTTEGLYRVYEEQGGREYIFKRLMTAINQAGSNNRQKSVNAVVELFNLTTSAGIKLPYINKGAGSDGSFVTTDCVATGVDCNAFVSWAVDKGVPNGFQWRPCAGSNGLIEVGTEIEFENWDKAKPGDIFSRYMNGDHSAYLLQNYPEHRVFVIAQASGGPRGITLSQVSYDALKSEGMVLRNLDKVYSGEDQESRLNPVQKPCDKNYSTVNQELH